MESNHACIICCENKAASNCIPLAKTSYAGQERRRVNFEHGADGGDSVEVKQEHVDEEEQEVDKGFGLTEGLTLFAKIVGNNPKWDLLDTLLYTDGGQEEEGDGVEVASVFCVECGKALEDVARFQRIIEFNQACQMERIGNLKKSLEASVRGVSSSDWSKEEDARWWSQIRRILLECVGALSHSTRPKRISKVPQRFRQERESGPFKRKRNRVLMSEDHDYPSQADKGDEIKPCSVVLERVLRGASLNEGSVTLLPSGSLPRNKRNVIRKRVKGEENDCNWDNNELEDFSDINAGVKDVISSGDEYLPSVCENDDVDEDVPSENDSDFNACEKNDLQTQTEAGRKVIGGRNKGTRKNRDAPIKKGQIKERKRTSSKRMLQFFSPKEGNVLLFNNTPIQYELNQHLTCLEPRCSVRIEGTDSNAFQQFRAHVTDSHLAENNYSDKERRCPICNVACCNGRKLQRHVFQAHGPIRTICEICCKAISSHNFKLHWKRHEGGMPLRPEGEHLFYSSQKGNLVVFKNTPVKYAFNQHFTCQEPGCGVKIENTDSTAFQQLRDHIVMFQVSWK